MSLQAMNNLPASSAIPTLLGLPVELRARIFALVLRPDYGVYCRKNHQHPDSWLGCTILLSVCRQIYDEAIEPFHRRNDPPSLVIDGKCRDLLRHPVEFGKPSFFNSSRPSAKCYMPKKFDELQIIRMRKFTIQVFFPDFNRYTYDAVSDNLVRHVGCLAAVLKKSKTLTTLIVQLERKDIAWTSKDMPLDSHPSMERALQPLTDSALQTGYILAVQDHLALPPDRMAEPLVPWFVSAARVAGAKAIEVEPEIWPTR